MERKRGKQQRRLSSRRKQHFCIKQHKAIPASTYTFSQRAVHTFICSSTFTSSCSARLTAFSSEIFCLALLNKRYNEESEISRTQLASKFHLYKRFMFTLRYLPWMDVETTAGCRFFLPFVLGITTYSYSRL